MLVPALAPREASARPLNVCYYDELPVHCYGYVTWPNAVHGSITQFQMIHLYSINDGTDFIENEMWDVDTVNDYSPGSPSLVETGESMWPDILVIGIFMHGAYLVLV